MTESKRIILNTLASYGKSIVTLPLHLLSARWILQGLGADDFGLHGVVGCVVFFITFINAVSSQAVSRFYAFSVGVDKKNGCATDEVRRWFNIAFSVHLILPFVLISIGYPIGVYAIHHWLVIPPARLGAAVWVFRLSLISSFFGMLYVPYVALYMAHQLIVNLTVFTLVGTFCSTIFAYFFAHLGGDHLIVYACGSLLLSAIIGGIQVLYAHHRFPAARLVPSLMFKIKPIMEMLSFAWWRLFASIGWMLRTQGSAVLVNLNFGVAANAAISVANQLAGQTAAFSAHLGNALMPAIVTSAGAGQRQHTIDLVSRSCKFGTLLVLLFAIPMILECDYVLHLWLGTPPAGASSLCVCMILAFIIDRLTAGHDYALTATGKMAIWQTWEAFSHASALLVGWIFIRLGVSVVALGYAYISTMLLVGGGRIYFARRLAGVGVMPLVRRVIVPTSVVGILAAVGGVVCIRFMPESFWRLCLTSALTMWMLSIASWYGVLDSVERSYLISQVMKILPPRKGNR